MAIVLRIFLCIFVFGFFLYSYIDEQNGLIELRVSIPRVEKELKRIQEDNAQLRFQQEQLESPIYLMELARKPEYGHLHYPALKDVIILLKPPPLEEANHG